MGKSNRFWMGGCLSAVSLVMLAAPAAPAFAQDANTGLLGDMGGLRTDLGKYGISFSASDSENLLGNFAGGVKNGATLQGVLTLGLDVDTGKAFGLQGGTLHVTALQLHGRPLTPSYLDNLNAANGNEGENATRLWELWYDQQFLNNKFDIKIGQQSIDNEFMGSTYSALFVNTMAGWPLIPSVDLYGGGPAYPLSSLGVRLQTEPTSNTTILAGVFDDNPGGGAFDDDAQQLDHGGTLFNLNSGALWIAEIQQSVKLGGLPGTYKFGGWYDSATFPDQRFDEMHRGNYSLYGVVDQTIWQSKTDSSRNLNVFGRLMGAPSNQNLVSLSFNGGVTLAAPVPGRDNDSAGIDFGLGKVSDRAADADRDAGLKPRGTEELIELTYQAQITPWLIAQPDLQYIWTPGGGIQDPNDPSHSLRNELVIGARGVVTF
jgi:porin